MTRLIYIYLLFLPLITISCSNDEDDFPELPSNLPVDIILDWDDGTGTLDLGTSGFIIENPDAASWCTSTISGNNLIVTASNNEGNNSHNRTVTYSLRSSTGTRKIVIAQRAQTHITTNGNIPLVSKEGGSYSMSITSNVGFHPQIPDDAKSWLRAQVSRTSGLTLVFSPNSDDLNRQTTISLTDEYGYEIYSLTVCQKGNQPLNVIYYTTVDDQPINVKVNTYFMSDIVSGHTYTNGLGKITFKTIPTKAIDNPPSFSNIKTISLPDSIKVFSLEGHCEKLEEIYLPAGLLEIAGFQHCKALKSITLPPSVTKIFYHTFYACTALQSITLPSSLRELGEGCFQDCSSLKTITLPSSLKKIGDRCFKDCNSLQSLVIPSSVEEIGQECFSGMDKDSEVTITIDGKIKNDHIFSDFNGYVNFAPDSRPEECPCLTTIFDSELCTPKFRGSWASDDNRCLIVNGTLYYANLFDYQKAEYHFPGGIKRIAQKSIQHPKLGISFTPTRLYFAEGLEETVGNILNMYVSHWTPQCFLMVFPTTFKRFLSGEGEFFWDTSSLTQSYTGWVFCFTSPIPPEFGLSELGSFITGTIPLHLFVPKGSLDIYKNEWPDYSNYMVEASPEDVNNYNYW